MAFCLPVFAYEDKTTHVLLTKKVLEKTSSIPAEFTQKVIQGAIDEDIFPRYANHFYDPVAFGFGDVGLKGYRSAKDWAFYDLNEYSWDNAIKYYVEGDKEKAYYALGHVIHLVQDMALPDHTRDDFHAGAYLPYEATGVSYLERWADGVDWLSFNGDKLDYQKIEEIFDYLAKYSNENFFSASTIFYEKYSKPVGKSRDMGFGYGEDSLSGRIFRLYKIFKDRAGEGETKTLDSELVLSDYWRFLSAQAVAGSVNVVEIFQREAEAARIAREKELAGRGVLGRIIHSISDPIGDIAYKTYQFTTDKARNAGNMAVVATTDTFYSVVRPVQSLASAAYSQLSDIFAGQKEANLATLNPVVDLNPKSPSENPALSAVNPVSEILLPQKEEVALMKAPLPVIVSAVPVLAVSSISAPVQARALVGGGGSSADDLVNNPTSAPAPVVLPVVEKKVEEVKTSSGLVGLGPKEEEKASEPPILVVPEPPKDTTSPDAPIILSPQSFDNIFTQATIIFSGTAEASSTISTDFSSATTSVGAENAWLLSLNFPEGETAVNFSAKDEAGNISSSTMVAIRVDSSAPDVSLAISECAGSISSDGCLVATTTLNIFWSSNSADLDFFEITQDGTASSTTATSTKILIADGNTLNFSVTAVDKAGNKSAPIEKSAEISLEPVVINEVAWMGSHKHPNAEWIELYNRTQKTIDFSNSNWILSTRLLKPYIKLSGAIQPGGYFLLERSNDSSVSDVPADQIYGNGGANWALNNNGEILTLYRASTTIDKTPTTFNGSWPAGSTGITGSEYYRTMERYSSDLVGGDTSSWGTNLGTIRNGKDPEGGSFAGTPRARNSVNYLVNRGMDIVSDFTIKKSSGPYLVSKNNALRVRAGKTLTIESGVVIKFLDGAVVVADGNIVVKGAEGAPVVFTSFYDDEYGGDMNGDGICAPENASSTAICPRQDAWAGIMINETSTSSSLDYMRLRYGGSHGGNPRGSLHVFSVSPEITNSVFENTYTYGLYLVDSNSKISGSVFRNNTIGRYASGFPLGAAGGIYVSGGAADITNSEFINNAVGIQAYGLAGNIKGNTFSGNTNKGIEFAGAMRGEISGNVALHPTPNNLGDMVIISGNISAPEKGEWATSTLLYNPMPYYVNSSLRVLAKSALEIKEGVEVKSSFNGSASYFTVEGNLTIEGTSERPVVFSANAATTTVSQESWDGLKFMNDSRVKISWAEFRDARTALTYKKSPINLSNVTFRNNKLAISADRDSVVETIKNVLFDRNTATTSPSGLW